MTKIVIDNKDINYIDMGNGQNIVIFHGWGSDIEKWREVIKLLSNSYRVVAIDFPGFGGSYMPTRDYSVTDYAIMVEKVLSKLKVDDYYLLGHSFGGRVAIKMAVRKNKIKGLILTGSAGIKDKLSVKKLMFLPVAKMGKLVFKLPLLKRFEGFAKFILYRSAKEQDYYKADALKGTFRKVVKEDLTKHLSHINVPTFLIWGEKDTYTPLRHARIMNKKIKDCELLVISNGSHTYPYQKPEEFVNHVHEFIKSN